MQTRLAGIRQATRSRIAQYPSIYFSLLALKSKKPPIIGPTTEIVIDGFPRSANTFAVLAFRRSQRRQVEIAHHTHTPAQIIRAVQWSVPVLLLVRQPEAAITSLMLRNPALGPDGCLREYIRFYRRLYGSRNALVIGEFDQVVADFGRVIARVNARYGTDFSVEPHSKEFERAVFEAIDALRDSREGTPVTLARPTGEKETRKSSIRGQLRDARRAPLLAEAFQWFERYRELAYRADA